MKRHTIVLIIMGFATVLTVWGLTRAKEKMTIMIWASEKVHYIEAEVARSFREQTNGLMGRESLEEKEGMIFVYQSDLKPSFWMKNMLIPIDMVFIGNDRLIKHIEKNVPPCQMPDNQCVRYRPHVPIRYVLELQGGFTEKNQVEVGDRVVLFMDPIYPGISDAP
jgi:hypothetical protein